MLEEGRGEMMLEEGRGEMELGWLRIDLILTAQDVRAFQRARQLLMQ